VLLHNRNKFHSIPLARAVHVKETYEKPSGFAAKVHMKNTGGYMRQPKSYSNADWAAKGIH
jgi:hypothetical protein